MTATDIFSPEIRQEIIKTLQFAEGHLMETTGISFITSVRIEKSEPTENYTDENRADDIILTVCDTLGQTVDSVKDHSRKGEKVDCRRIAISLIKDYTLLSLKNIGIKFDGRDHSTVIHALQAHKDLLETDKAYLRKYNRCAEAVKAMSLGKLTEKITITLKDLQ